VTTVVDADVLIGILRGVTGAQRAVSEARRRSERVMSVTPVRTEVLRGMLPGEEAATSTLFGLLEWVTVDAALADRAGELARAYWRSHSGIEIVDLLLAAAVERFGADLLTRNVRHFPMFPGLHPAY
jgi:predicted nucleic acid-binding protein